MRSLSRKRKNRFAFTGYEWSFGPSPFTHLYATSRYTKLLLWLVRRFLEPRRERMYQEYCVRRWQEIMDVESGFGWARHGRRDAQRQN